MQLGSISVESEDGPRGPDLGVVVQVARTALADPAGVSVSIPAELETAQGLVARTISPWDDGETVVLRLPPGFPDGGTIRLRGQGGACPGGRPGDLLVTVEVANRPRFGLDIRRGAGFAITIAIALASGLALGWLWLGA